MAGTLQALTLHPKITATTNFRHRKLFPPASHSQFSGEQSNTVPLQWKLRSVSRARIVGARARFPQGNGSGEGPISRSSSSSWFEPVVKFVGNNFLPIALVSGVALGLANPSLGCIADRYHLSKFSTFGIFIISGLTLRSDEISAATEAWPVALFGIGSILFITPLFAKIILLLKLQPQEFVTGLAIFSCMPTTLSSGVALTRLAGGNSALALAMTLISNLLGILIPPDFVLMSWHIFLALVSVLFESYAKLTPQELLDLWKPCYYIPFSISNFIGAGVGVSVPTEKLLRSLVLTLLVPLILGKVAREFSKGLAGFVDGHRKRLSVISAILLGFVPWIQVSRSGSLLRMVKPAIFLVAVLMGALLHATLLAFNALAIQSISAVSGGSKSPFAKKENANALLLVASQKTLPVMVAVVEQLGGALGVSGLLVLPCVAAHLNQIIMDSFLVSFWRSKEEASNNTKFA